MNRIPMTKQEILESIYPYDSCFILPHQLEEIKKQMKQYDSCLQVQIQNPVNVPQLTLEQQEDECKNTVITVRADCQSPKTN